MEEPNENSNEKVQLNNLPENTEIENQTDTDSSQIQNSQSLEINQNGEIAENEASLVENEIKPEQEVEKPKIDSQPSTEFTYFSLGSKPDEIEDAPSEDNSGEKQKVEDIKLEEINLENNEEESQTEETKQDLEQKVNEEVETKSEVVEVKKVESNAQLNGDSHLTNNLQIDEMIEKIRENSVSNKDVCNYVLNLLVDGEFDLEKNFVIKNYKTILLMMQVIKCANPSLKAELWSLFTAILRKSQLNLQACVEIGLIETALHELEDADEVCADLIVEMLTVLANYNINVEELKAIFNRLKGEDQSWVI